MSHFPCLFLYLILAFSPAFAAEALHTWTDVVGRKVDAVFVSLDDSVEPNRITIRLGNGRLSTFDLTRLIEADQEYARNLPPCGAPAPQLVISSTATGVKLQWIQNSTQSWAVYSAASLSGAWSPLATMTLVDGDVRSVEAVRVGSLRFYRLVTN